MTGKALTVAIANSCQVVTKASADIKNRSPVRNSATWPGAWPGTNIACHLGKNGTLPSVDRDSIVFLG
ncbi:hypothetical protein AB6735_06690 [Mucilaginibacter sp. RCC_168]|uniref:hypothetical protein n=1 Tax=Mucilaginibacter sp. RCC_168 TaxID=3239221 RepID=UPI00352438D7